MTIRAEANAARHDPLWALERDREALLGQVHLCRREASMLGAAAALRDRAVAFAVPRVVSLLGLGAIVVALVLALID